MEKKFWFVEHPTHQYNEDVKKLAHINMLEIVDAKFKDSIDPDFVVADKDAPKLTKIKKPAKAKAKVDADAVDLDPAQKD